MKHEFRIKVYPGDTDSYGVVWHGAYIKWLEAGRIEALEQIGIKFLEMDAMGILMPVVELEIKYKHFCRPYDDLSIESSIEQFNTTDIVFYQEIKNIKTGRIVLTAKAKGVTTSREGKLFKVIPDYLREKYKAAVNLTV
ncbi:MAG TPA: thioesterase family protein [Candidatus Gastranaerophilales bacterium]|nr:thioesterase family protein [Candidatus Gastranaerophilales bacterium]